MNEFNTLWIDDDWVSTSASYKSLNIIKNELERGNPDIKIKTISNIGIGLSAIIRSNDKSNNNTDNNKHYDLIIIDLQFKNITDPDEQRYTDLIESLSLKGVPFVIYTSQRKPYENDLRTIKKQYKNNLIGIYDKASKGDEDFIKDIVTISQFKPLTILHLSDFHYDSTLNEIQANQQKKLFSTLINFLKKENNSSPIDFIVFSGDYASKMPEKDLSGCAEILREIVKNTTNDFDKLLIVPGNHDAYWNNFSKGETSQIPGKYLEEFYKKVFDNSLNFIHQLVGYTKLNFNQSTLDSFCFTQEFNQGKIKILGLNSVFLDPHNKGIGMISHDVIQYIENSNWAKAEPLPNELRIAIFHHNIFPNFSLNNLDTNEGLINAGLIINLLTKYKCNLILTGHSHFSNFFNLSFSCLNYQGYSEIRHITSICTNTTGGYAPTNDRQRSFNIIKISPTNTKELKSLKITPIFFDSTESDWKKGLELNTSIIQDSISTRGRG